jgi:hypothetical protein
LFAEDCSACHSLVGNESLHRQGGDLLGYRFGRRDLLQFTREMPVRHQLSRVQLAAIVDYLSAEEGSAKKGSTEEGSTEEGSAKEGSAGEGSAKEGSAKEGSTKKGSTGEGSAGGGSAGGR